VEVATGRGGGDCGYAFERGRDYLVYASEAEGILQTGICSRTARAERAAEDLSYLRGLSKGETPSRVFGTVTGPAWQVPIANVPVRLELSGVVKTTTTNAAGQYSFDSLPVGTFEVSASLSNNWGGGESRSVRLGNQACSQQDFFAVERAKLTGNLRDDEGRPVESTIVSMMSTDPSRRSIVLESFTRFGRFTIDRIPPGDYWLGVNITHSPRITHPFPPTYFPGVHESEKATVIHVESAQELTDFEFRLPTSSSRRSITGRVLLPNGKPAGGWVELRDMQFPDELVDIQYPKADGTFSVSGVQGRSYSLTAVRSRGERLIREQRELTNSDNGPINFVLTMP
jgi:hypothetical protein